MNKHNSRSQYRNVIDGLTIDDVLDKLEEVYTIEIPATHDEYTSQTFLEKTHIDHLHFLVPLTYTGSLEEAVEQTVKVLGDPLYAKFGGRHLFLDYGCIYVLKVNVGVSGEKFTYKGFVTTDSAYGLLTPKKEFTRLKIEVKQSHREQAEQIVESITEADLINPQTFYALLKQEEEN